MDMYFVSSFDKDRDPLSSFWAQQGSPWGPPRSDSLQSPTWDGVGITLGSGVPFALSPPTIISPASSAISSRKMAIISPLELGALLKLEQALGGRQARVLTSQETVKIGVRKACLLHSSHGQIREGGS